MKSRYKGANKSNKSLLKKVLVVGVIVAIFIFAEKYVSRDDSQLIQETTNIVVKS
ncbi:MAG: hypothetical protein LBQ34_01270 [Alphaproteobacteria bacterium]|jgi:hypothetical protein|nr:hypothetical protein [Alphaproteobacteria bacterium]